MSKYCFEIKATDANNTRKLENAVDKFKNEITLMNFTNAQTDCIFSLTQNVLDTYSECLNSVISKTDKKLVTSVNGLAQCLKETLSTHSSAFKRKKTIEKEKTFVPPEEKAISCKWIQTMDEQSGRIVRKYVQTTFQFIPPSAIIKSLFEDPDFVKLYTEHTLNKSHECREGVYLDYCCGEHFRKNALLKEDPNAIRIQLYTDEFEPCDALKSKAEKHKQIAFYMIIRNMPLKLQSKLSNIHLVALADSKDLTNPSSIQKIIAVILEDLKMLESTGIRVATGEIVKACLITISFDNLGGNICYG